MKKNKHKNQRVMNNKKITSKDEAIQVLSKLPYTVLLRLAILADNKKALNYLENEQKFKILTSLL